MPTGHPQGTTSPACPPATSISAPPWSGRRAAAKHQPADLADRGQGLAAEPQRADAEQVVGLGELARGVGGDGQRQLFGRDSAAVVRHPHQVQSAVGGGNVDPRGPGIDGVFHQLLDHARRPFDDLAGRDLVDEGLGRRWMGMRDERLRAGWVSAG